MTKVELIYDSDCPNVDDARRVLREAFVQADRAPRWVEWNRASRNSPDYVRRYGSPTILVDGQDVSTRRRDGEGASGRPLSAGVRGAGITADSAKTPTMGGTPGLLDDSEDGCACRVYRDGKGAISGTPTVESIVHALTGKE